MVAGLYNTSRLGSARPSLLKFCHIVFYFQFNPVRNFSHFNIMTLTKAAIDSIVLNVVLLTLAILAVGLRFTARRKSSTSIGWNDWTILIALVSVRQHDIT